MHFLPPQPGNGCQLMLYNYCNKQQFTSVYALATFWVCTISRTWTTCSKTVYEPITNYEEYLVQTLSTACQGNPTLLTGLLLNSHWHVLKCCLEISTAVLFCYTPSFKCSSIAPALYLSTEGDYWIPFINRTTTAHKYPHRRVFSTLNKWTERNWAVFPGEGATRARGSKRQWDILTAKT